MPHAALSEPTPIRRRKAVVASPPSATAVADAAPPASLSPSQAKVFAALSQPPGRPVACATLAEILYGAAGAEHIGNALRMVANLKIVLVAQGRWTIVSRGWRDELAYSLVPAETVDATSKAMPKSRAEPAPPVPTEPVGSGRRRRPPGSVTLPPCGYAAWSYRHNGDHAVQLPGEDRARVLTPSDRRLYGLTTDRGAFETPAVPDDEA